VGNQRSGSGDHLLPHDAFTPRWPRLQGQTDGYQARRLAGGLPEWRLAGLPVAGGLEVTA
jgi:hypothetical protein